MLVERNAGSRSQKRPSQPLPVFGESRTRAMSNPLVKPIHPKAMPVILHPDDYDKWLAGDDAKEFAVPFPSQLMSLVPDRP